MCRDCSRVLHFQNLDLPRLQSMQMLNPLVLVIITSVAFASNDTFREIVYLPNGQTYHVGYFDMPIDHFSHTNEEHFHLRYVVFG